MSEGIGVSVRRKEDKKFLTGKGRYTDDISRPGQVHAFFVRSDVAHANIKSINIKSAKEAEGVVAVYTGDDVAADGIGGPICGVYTGRKGGPAKNRFPENPSRPPLAPYSFCLGFTKTAQKAKSAPHVPDRLPL